MTAHGNKPVGPPIHGMAARFEDASALTAAARAARLQGYQRMDAYSPFPIHEMDEALGIRRSILPMLVLAAGIAGCVGGFAMQYWMSVVDYPLNIAGKPLVSWPQWVPVAFETTVLLAALTAAFGMFALNGFPMPYHPMFNVKGFDRVTTDAFFLCIEADDPLFDASNTAKFLQDLGALEVSEVVH